jgi:hypothetical protein
MSNWLADQLTALRNCFFLEKPTSNDVQAALVELAKEVPKVAPFDNDAIMACIRANNRKDAVLIRGKLFSYVNFRSGHFSPVGGNGRHIEVLTCMPDNFHLHMDYLPIPAEFYPRSPEDIEAPGVWIEDIDKCDQLVGYMKDVMQQIGWASKLIKKGQPYQFVKAGECYLPCIKLYTDLSWIDMGWEGPAIIVGCYGDRRVPTASGIIPDEAKLYDMSEVFNILEEFRTGPLQDMLDNHESVIEFKHTFEAFIKYLDDKSITYR